MDSNWRVAVKRNTFHYISACKDMEECESLDWQWQQISESDIIEDEGSVDEIIGKSYIIATTKPVDFDEFSNVMRFYFLRGCNCEHDCCGCLFGGVHAIYQRSETNFEVKTSYSRNY